MTLKAMTREEYQKVRVELCVSLWKLNIEDVSEEIGSPFVSYCQRLYQVSRVFVNIDFHHICDLGLRCCITSNNAVKSFPYWNVKECVLFFCSQQVFHYEWIQMRVWKLNGALQGQRFCLRLCLIQSEAHVTEKLRGTKWTQNSVSCGSIRLVNVAPLCIYCTIM